jgi:hypothetical protein
MYRIILSIGVIVVVFTGIAFFVFGGAFRQNEPHLAVLTSIIRLHLTGDEIVPIQGRLFMTKTNKQNAPIISLLEGRGWMFVDQMGSGLIFEKEGETLTVDTRQYSRYYRIIELSE